jgi:hypothetical protein
MKKAFFPLLLVALTISNITYAQGLANATKSKKQIENIISESNTDVKNDSAVWNGINVNAIRNFMREYKNVSDTKWFESSNGFFVAYFVRDDIRSWVFYNKKGDFERMIRAYNEEKLPAAVRHLVKSTYYDFSIYFVTEITTNMQTAYHVKMADKTSWKTIKVVEGEMEVTEEYVKSE